MKIISMKGLVEKAHGKICQDDNNSVAYRKKDGAMFSNRRCHERDLNEKPYSAREIEIRNQFTINSKAAAAWTRANRKYKENSREIDLAASTEDYRKMRAAYNAQDDIVSFQAFVWSQVKNGAVVVPDVDAGTSPSGGSGGNSSPTPSGGGEEETM